MLDLPRYLLGVGELLLLASFATLGAAALRARLLPAFTGAPAVLATAVLALTIPILTAELLGTVGLFDPAPYLIMVIAVALAARLTVAGGWGGSSGAAASCFSPRRRSRTAADSPGEKPSKTEGPPHPPYLITFVALAIAAVAVMKFGVEVKPKLTTGMTGFDSTWYHGPFAAGFFQSGSTWDLHFIAPQFLAWFYPANAEIFHGVGMLAFGRDLLSPLLNLGWFVGCLLACWCIGRPYRVAPWSLALGAIALSLPVLSDQAGEARNDIVGIFFLLATVAIALNATPTDEAQPDVPGSRTDGSRTPLLEPGAVLVVGLAAGLAAGTKLNFLLPAAALVLGLALLVPAGRRWRAMALGALAALLGGGYWYLRNLVHAGNPLPWFTEIGPISLPGPDQELGGREGHSVLGYLLDGAVWSDWFLPGLSDGLTILWPLVLALALAGLLLSAANPSFRCALAARSADKEQRNGVGLALGVAGLTGLAAVLAWLIAPTSASGPEGMPRGFESGLRYLAPALVLGLALIPVVLSTRFRGEDAGHPPNGRILKVPRSLARHLSGRGMPRGLPAGAVIVIAIAFGYPIQRHYLQNRYAEPSFTAPGLNAAFAWSRGITDARIATTGTRQYPLFGTDLSNHVQFLGEPRPQSGFVAPPTCPRYRRLVNEGDYDYVIATRDRVEPAKPPYPPAAAWTESPGTRVILRRPPTIVFELTKPLDPSACK